MKKFADINAFIDDALQRAKTQAALPPAYGGGSTSMIAQALGLPTVDWRTLDPATIARQKALGETSALLELGSNKWNSFKGLLPYAGAAVGGAYLVRNLYNNWKNKQIANQIIDDPDLSGKYEAKQLRNAVDQMHRYAPSYLNDPIAAKDMVGRMLAYDGLTVKDRAELIDAEKRYREVHGLGSVASPIADVLKSVL